MGILGGGGFLWEIFVGGGGEEIHSSSMIFLASSWGKFLASGSFHEY